MVVVTSSFLVVCNPARSMSSAATASLPTWGEISLMCSCSAFASAVDNAFKIHYLVVARGVWRTYALTGLGVNSGQGNESFQTPSQFDVQVVPPPQAEGLQLTDQ